MKIALNGQNILIDEPAGPERFAISLYKELAHADNKNEYVLLFDKNPKPEFVEEMFGSNKNFSYKVLKKSLSWTHVNLAYELLTGGYDLFFTYIHTIPILKGFGIKYCAMIHGLEYKKNQIYNKFSFRNLIPPLILQWILVFADAIIVPSYATKNEIINNLALGKFFKHKLNIISEGVADEFYAGDLTRLGLICRQYGLTEGKYLLSVSTIQPRKNFARLIHAFSIALHEKPELKEYKLVIAGKLGWNYTETLAAPAKYNIENNVKFLKWIPQEDVPLLMSGAKGYINVSLEEGFGLTILEAMASKIPAVASDIPAYTELGEDTIDYVNPYDITRISEKIISMLQSPIKDETLQKAYTRSKEFTWNKTAQKIIGLFSSLKSH